MAKKKSKWIKANADTARELEASRDRRDRDERTGGSLRGKSDSALFAIDKVKGGSRALFKKDGLLTSVRRTMTGLNTKPAKVARPLKGQKAPPPFKHAKKRSAAPPSKRHEPVEYGFDAWGEDADGLKAPVVPLRTSIGQLVNPRAPPRPEPSLASAVEVLVPGGSYNPTYEAHQALLQSALNSELERQAAKQRYADAHAARNVEEVNQVGDGSDGGDEEEDEGDAAGGGARAGGGMADSGEAGEGGEGGEGEDEDARALAAREAHAAERKTRTERNKMARRKAHALAEAGRQKAKALDKQLKRVAAIAKELDAAERTRAELEASRPRRPEEVLGVPKKLGKYKQRAEPWAALLSDELPSSMRTLPPANNLLSDRFRSVHKRNLMEPRMVQVKKRRYALKEYTKKGFKEEDWKSL